MDALLHDIVPLLLRLGPWILFLVVAAETAIFLGLLVPAEATVLLAGFLASRGYFDVEMVLLATVGGAIAGDQIGYGLGRVWGQRVAARQGRIGRLWNRHEERVILLFRRRAVVAITLSRFVSFVRTLTPWFAGMSRLRYRRFVAYDVPGAAGWAAASVAAGYAAGASWRLMAGAIGTFSAGLILAGGVVAGVAALRRRRRGGCTASA